MSKRQLIDEIRHYNPGATPEFLEQFDESSLDQYLERLQGATERRLHLHSTSATASKLRKVS